MKKKDYINLNLDELRALILNAVMTGNQTKTIDLENAPDECPMDIILACEFVLKSFLDGKMKSLFDQFEKEDEEDDINRQIQKLLKGTN